MKLFRQDDKLEDILISDLFPSSVRRTKTVESLINSILNTDDLKSPGLVECPECGYAFIIPCHLISNYTSQNMLLITLSAVRCQTKLRLPHFMPEALYA